MASATKRGQGKWLGRYRGPDGRERTKMFPTKGEARAWAEAQEARMRRGEWSDPSMARITVREWAPIWQATLAVKPKTAHSYDSLLRTCVLPRWGSVRLDQITLAEVRTWVAGMTGQDGEPLSPSRVRQAHHVLKAMLDLAVEDGRLIRNPAKPTSGKLKHMLPKVATAKPHRYLSHSQLIALSEHAGEHKALILVMGYCGLRWGEVSALQVRDLDLLARRLHVRRSVSDVGGVLMFSTTKTHETRAVPFPQSLAPLLEAQINGRGPDDPLFPAPHGNFLHPRNFRTRVFDKAVKDAGLPFITPHDLRHTAASLAVASGATVKAVQKMLGHASAAMTLDVYAGLFDDELDSVAERLEMGVSAARADYLRTADAASAPIAHLSGAGNAV